MSLKSSDRKSSSDFIGQKRKLESASDDVRIHPDNNDDNYILTQEELDNLPVLKLTRSYGCYDHSCTPNPRLPNPYSRVPVKYGGSLEDDYDASEHPVRQGREAWADLVNKY